MADKTVVIRCKLKRAGGSKIDLYGKTYHFKAEDPANDTPDTPHLCAIPFADARAIYRLLSIREAYELADPDAELPPRPAADPVNTIAAAAATGEKPAAKPVIIKNEAGEEINLTELGETAPDKLRELARDTFGVKVHHKWSNERVIQTIVEAMRGEG